MPSRVLSFAAVHLCLAASCLAQQNVCTISDVPVAVISVSGDVFRGLAAEDFVGRTQKKPVGVKSLAFDDGPRRVALVVDTSNKLSADSRRAEKELVEVILAGARPEDTFALLSARGPGIDMNFTADHGSIIRALGVNESRGGKDPGVLDAVMTAIEQFGGHQNGDAIVVIAAEMEGNHKANAKMVAKALEDHHIRMFGLALGLVTTKSSVAGGSMTSTTSQGLAWTTPEVGDIVYNTGDEHFFPLTVNSGGMVLGVMGADPRRDSNMSDARVVQRVQQKARAVSKMINSFYRVQVEPPPGSRPEDWSLEISETITKHSQPMLVLYPHALGPC